MANPKTRFYVLMGFALLVGCYIVFGSTREALNLHKENKQLESSLIQLQDADGVLASLREKSNTYKTRLTYVNLTEESMQELLLDAINNFCVDRRLEMTGMTETKYVAFESHEIELNTVIVKGDFFDTLLLMKMLENTDRLSKIVSAKMIVQKDHNRKERLFTEISLENINMK